MLFRAFLFFMTFLLCPILLFASPLPDSLDLNIDSTNATWSPLIEISNDESYPGTSRTSLFKLNNGNMIGMSYSNSTQLPANSLCVALIDKYSTHTSINNHQVHSGPLKSISYFYNDDQLFTICKLGGRSRIRQISDNGDFHVNSGFTVGSPTEPAYGTGIPATPILQADSSFAIWSNTASENNNLLNNLMVYRLNPDISATIDSSRITTIDSIDAGRIIQDSNGIVHVAVSKAMPHPTFGVHHIYFIK